MPDPKIFTPIIIAVSSGEWVAIPMGNVKTERDKMLIREIRLRGGIDHTVPPGVYHFNIVPFNGKDIVTLVPQNS